MSNRYTLCCTLLRQMLISFLYFDILTCHTLLLLKSKILLLIDGFKESNLHLGEFGLQIKLVRCRNGKRAFYLIVIYLFSKGVQLLSYENKLLCLT